VGRKRLPLAITIFLRICFGSVETEADVSLPHSTCSA
jgi:hypothetical protein